MCKKYITTLNKFTHFNYNKAFRKKGFFNAYYIFVVVYTTKPTVKTPKKIRCFHGCTGKILFPFL